MDVIWGKREAKYFYLKDWTGSISLIRFNKFADTRKAVEQATSRIVIASQRVATNARPMTGSAKPSIAIELISQQIFFCMR
jgi:hypothetical protein